MGNVVSLSASSLMSKNNDESVKYTFATAAMAKYMSLSKEQILAIRREVNLNSNVVHDSYRKNDKNKTGNNNNNSQLQPASVSSMNHYSSNKSTSMSTVTKDSNSAHTRTSSTCFNEMTTLIDQNKRFHRGLNNNGLYITRDGYKDALMKANVCQSRDIEILDLIFTALDVECEGSVATDELCVGISMLACSDAVDFEAVLRFAITIYFYCNSVIQHSTNSHTKIISIDKSSGRRFRSSRLFTQTADALMLKLHQNQNSRLGNNSNNSNQNRNNSNNDGDGMISSKDAISILRSMNLTASYLGDTNVMDHVKIYKLVDNIFETISLLMDDDTADNLMSQNEFCTKFCNEPYVRSMLFATQCNKKIIPKVAQTKDGEQSSSRPVIGNDPTTSDKNGDKSSHQSLLLTSFYNTTKEQKRTMESSRFYTSKMKQEKQQIPVENKKKDLNYGELYTSKKPTSVLTSHQHFPGNNYVPNTYLASIRSGQTGSLFESFISSTRQKPIVESYFTEESCEENTTVFTFPDPTDDENIATDVNKNSIIKNTLVSEQNHTSQVVYGDDKNHSKKMDNMKENDVIPRIHPLSGEQKSLTTDDTSTDFFPNPIPFSEMQHERIQEQHHQPLRIFNNSTYHSKGNGGSSNSNRQKLVHSSDEIVDGVEVIEATDSSSASTDLSSHMSKPMTPLAIIRVLPHTTVASF